ncbi:putative uncharacterized protein DDB_G0287265 [Amyelois transitella]|uniref:putative uncharacterized protein DDB_G0287265 n=1 Tax=Amyelois transitella TaxID=680683 RepID=UPI002990532A|nr:putative uncharacterized protein DDB_G0287265 [Amyelois transitella]
MIGAICFLLCLIRFYAVTVSGAEVYVINTKSNDGDVHRLSLAIDKKSLTFNPVTSGDPGKADAEKLFSIFKHSANLQPIEISPKQNRLFGNIYGSPKLQKKFKRPKHDNLNILEELEPFLKLLLNQKTPVVKKPFVDLTRVEKQFSEDYIDLGDISRKQPKSGFSQDYIDFRFLRKPYRPRRAIVGLKEALRSYNEDSDDDDEDDEETKSKRFEVVKNKHNQKDIKSDSPSDDSNDDVRKGSLEDLDSDEDFSELSDKITSKTKKKTKKAKKKASDEDKDVDKEVELYLQGNKLTMYPPMEDSGENSDDTRRLANRRMRMPYFLPKHYNWSQKDIPNLGYFFFNGPKGVSLDSD